MNNYIGVKLVQAEEMTLGAYNEYKGWTIPENEDPNQEGYRVHYSDAYVSWCPKDQFEKHNLQIEKTDSISQSDVDSFCASFTCFTIGDKTTVVNFKMRNDFEILESSACVDPKNYDKEVGFDICKDRAQDKVWFLLGFLLQSARVGFDKFDKFIGITHP
jgi:hypothetical protein